MISKLIAQKFPKKGEPPKPDGFCIMQYRCEDKEAVDENGNPLYHKEFVAWGRFLPNDKIAQYNLSGHWELSKNRGDYHFSVDSYETIVEKTKNGIMEYLASNIKGIGPKMAERIYNEFEDETLEVLDKDPEKLRGIKGITNKKLDGIITSYLETRASRDLQIALMPLGVSRAKIMKIYNKFKTKSVDIVKNHPYILVIESDFPFSIAEEIAQKNNKISHPMERVKAAIWEVLNQAENGGELFKVGSGSSCVEYIEIQKKTHMLLHYSVTPSDIVTALNELRQDKKIAVRNNPYNKTEWYVFKMSVDYLENETAKQVIRLMRKYKFDGYNIEEEIQRMQLKEKLLLAPEQKNAVTTALKNGFSVITGGPGTGKTTIIKFIRSIYLKKNPGRKILMCSPTGVAAVRMKESTNGEASTVHKALELKPTGDNISYAQYKILDEYDFIIVDETSMLDMYVAYSLLLAITHGSKVCFVGDIDQLPSVGPGAILRDIIESKVVPVARLIKVYRQKDDNLIPLNAQLIKNGKTSLDYGTSFNLIPARTFDEAAGKMKQAYMQEINMHGIQNVLMLSPYRVKTASCVNNMNLIRDAINPPASNKREVRFNEKIFRKGDKVINTKNVDEICNGDIGFITDIADKLTDDGKMETVLTIDFGHDRVVDFRQEDLENIDWAYATTVHKSQGSEADYVIINIMSGHAFMLKRNLLYTAVTRAKKGVIIIGEKEAVERAILSGVSEEEKRKTLLSQRIAWFYRNLVDAV